MNDIHDFSAGFTWLLTFFYLFIFILLFFKIYLFLFFLTKKIRGLKQDDSGVFVNLSHTRTAIICTNNAPYTVQTHTHTHTPKLRSQSTNIALCDARARLRSVCRAPVGRRRYCITRHSIGVRRGLNKADDRAEIIFLKSRQRMVPRRRMKNQF